MPSIRSNPSSYTAGLGKENQNPNAQVHRRYGQMEHRDLVQTERRRAHPFQFRGRPSDQILYKLDTNRIRQSYRKEIPREYQDAKNKWRRIVAKQIRDRQKGIEWIRSASLSLLEYSHGRGLLTKGAEMMVGKEKNLLYHDTIDKCFDVDAYWDRKEEEPFLFVVEEEYVKAWIVAADGVTISVASAAVAPTAATPATAVDEV